MEGWKFTFNAEQLLAVFIEPYEALFTYQCILDNSDLTKEQRARGIKSFLDKNVNYNVNIVKVFWKECF